MTDFSTITHISFSNSGIDTDTIVQKIMQGEQVPLDQLKQKQQKDQWLSDAYRQWNTDLFNLNNDTVFNMKMSNSYDTFNVTSSDTNAVSATGTANAMEGTHNIKVTSLASAATMTGKTSFQPTDDLVPGTTYPNGMTLTISVSNPSSVNATQTGTVTIPKDAKIADVVAAFNSSKDSNGNSLGIQANYDSTLQQFILKTNTTGSGTKIDFSANPTGTGTAGDFLTQTLGLTNTTSPVFGTNADITFDEQPILNLSTNTATLLGVTYTFKGQTTSTDPTGVSINISRDIDTEVKNIEGFISKYNDMLGKLNSALSEPVYSGYQPLTDDQRSQMSDTQITQWETKAKSGLMNNDSILSGLVNKMRSAMTSIVNNGSTYNSLSSIGITSHNWTDQGKLYVDEDKLRAALQSDQKGVENLFKQLGDGVGDQTGKQGVVQSLSACLNDTYNQLVDKAGSPSNSQTDQSFIGKDLTSLQQQIDDMTTKLQAKEQTYYNQYDAMQQAVAQFQSQGNTLLQSLGLSTSTSTTG
jgi:flagellar hook-associated protein 2